MNEISFHSFDEKRHICPCKSSNLCCSFMCCPTSLTLLFLTASIVSTCLTLTVVNECFDLRCSNGFLKMMKKNCHAMVNRGENSKTESCKRKRRAASPCRRPPWRPASAISKAAILQFEDNTGGFLTSLFYIFSSFSIYFLN